MKYVFRTDASLLIGTGHVMRCITLADVLKERGNEVSFICRLHKGNLIQYIKDKGYGVYSLAIELPEHEETIQQSAGQDIDTLPHASWLGATQKKDAEDCQSVLDEIRPDWIIVDHYALDYRWQNELKGYYKKLMAIDDLADRRHECDLLLDQTFGRKEKDYRSRVPKDCHLLVGSQYALLRPEFSQWREYSLRRRAADPGLKKILITMGGVDLDNVTGQVLEKLKYCDLPKNLTITVVMGATALNLQKVKKTAEAMPNKTEVKENVTNMAELMANADLAIGAAGATTWERCCLGLPTLMVILAKNQELIASSIEEAGAAVIIDRHELEGICDKLVIDFINLKEVSSKASQVVDGQGANRIIERIL